MMKMDTLYNYLQGIQSLLAPAMVAVFAMGIFFKKITPKAGEYTMITGFLIGMLRLVTNVITDTGKATMMVHSGITPHGSGRPTGSYSSAGCSSSSSSSW